MVVGVVVAGGVGDAGVGVVVGGVVVAGGVVPSLLSLQPTAASVKSKQNVRFMFITSATCRCNRSASGGSEARLLHMIASALWEADFVARRIAAAPRRTGL
jgi:hypothetical protein